MGGRVDPSRYYDNYLKNAKKSSSKKEDKYLKSFHLTEALYTLFLTLIPHFMSGHWNHWKRNIQFSLIRKICTIAVSNAHKSTKLEKHKFKYN